MKKIGITAFYTQDKARRMSILDRQYAEAVIGQGALPVIIPTTPDFQLAECYIDSVDALLITGGCDVSPLYYHAQPNKAVTTFSQERDFFEEALIKSALGKEIPIMGICRGMQMINAALGGNLIQHIPDEVENAICHVQSSIEQREPCHSVKIEKGSMLYPIFGERGVVNSYHHQAVKELGRGLVPIAYSPDGICEAYECLEKKILAVQWHPEKMFLYDERQNRIFKAFVELI